MKATDLTDAIRTVAESVSALDIALRTDPLTGIGNALSMDESAKRIAAESSDWTLFFGDIDGFKMINDSHSHAVGDVAIKRVGASLMHIAGAFQGKLLPFRRSGDEFVLLCEVSVLEAVVADLESMSPVRFRMDKVNLDVSVSFGYAPLDDNTAAVLERAEEACQVSKHADHRVTKWNPDQKSNVLEWRFRCNACGASTTCRVEASKSCGQLHCPCCQAKVEVEVATA